MAQYTQEDVDKIRDSLRKKHDYENMPDDKKKEFDRKFDEEIENYRKQGIVEPKKNDTSDGDDDDVEANVDKGRERTMENRKDADKPKNDTKESREEALKKKEYERTDRLIDENQGRLEAERKEKEEEKDKDKKEKDFFDR